MAGGLSRAIMDRPFDKPLIISNGHTVVTLTSIWEAGSFLLNDWPLQHRRRKAYRAAIEACTRALVGGVEPEWRAKRSSPRSRIFPASLRQ